MGTGKIELWWTISCGSVECETADVFTPTKYEKRAHARDKWLADGWQIERPDDAHEDSWWQCPRCLRREG